MAIELVKPKVRFKRCVLREKILEIIKDHRSESIWFPEEDKYYPGITITHLVKHLTEYKVMPKKVSTVNRHLKSIMSEGLIDIYKLSSGVFYVRTHEAVSKK
jgi:hypothetical protein